MAKFKSQGPYTLFSLTSPNGHFVGTFSTLAEAKAHCKQVSKHPPGKWTVEGYPSLGIQSAYSKSCEFRIDSPYVIRLNLSSC